MAGVRFLLPPGGSGDETQVCECLYPLSPLPALPSHQNVFLKLGSFFVDLGVEAATSLGSLLLAFPPLWLPSFSWPNA